MGKLIERLKARKAGATPSTPTGGSAAAPHTADYVYAKHLYSQGLGPNPDASSAAPAAPAAGGGGASSPAPAGGMLDTPEDRKRRLLSGVQID
jgi:hypothetical protein